MFTVVHSGAASFVGVAQRVARRRASDGVTGAL
jgi:hypothetical protein